jgi:hypothetical protein
MGVTLAAAAHMAAQAIFRTGNCTYNLKHRQTWAHAILSSGDLNLQSTSNTAHFGNKENARQAPVGVRRPPSP